MPWNSTKCGELRASQPLRPSLRCPAQAGVFTTFAQPAPRPSVRPTARSFGADARNGLLRAARFCFLAALLLASAWTVQAEVQILVQPASQTLIAGQDAALIVEAIGLLPLSYQWRNEAGDIPDATGPILTLTQVQAAQAGHYS